MDPLEEDAIFEEKMDEITIQLEELVLDAMITALEKIRKRNHEFNSIESKKNDHMTF